jgi:hypothetical protein
MSYDTWLTTDTAAEEEAKRQALFDHYMNMVMTDCPYLSEDEAAGLAELMIGQKDDSWEEYCDWANNLVYDSSDSNMV